MCWNDISPTHSPKIIWIIYTYIITLLQWERRVPLFISPNPKMNGNEVWCGSILNERNCPEGWIQKAVEVKLLGCLFNCWLFMFSSVIHIFYSCVQLAWCIFSSKELVWQKSTYRQDPNSAHLRWLGPLINYWEKVPASTSDSLAWGRGICSSQKNMYYSSAHSFNSQIFHHCLAVIWILF